MADELRAVTRTVADDPERAQRRADGMRHELTSLLNRYCMESGSDTPDFILANYLMDCLRAFDLALQQREHWYGRCVKEPTK